MKKPLYGTIAICAMVIAILDTKTMILGAQSGIQLCLQTIIPALLPFIILSGIISNIFMGHNIKMLWPIRRICHIPSGSESLMLLSFLGGYPVGAQIITQAYSANSISKEDANRMLGFCNNAGPAFIFGMLSFIFSNSYISWILWSIHILSALSVGYILPYEAETKCHIHNAKEITLPILLKNSINSVSSICGWVIIFRIILCLFDRWLSWLVPKDHQVILSGILELSNGCLSLKNIENEHIRFIYASGMLAFGGLCVGMQTTSVTQGLGMGYYFPGKILQTEFSILYSLFISPIIFQNAVKKIYLCIILGLVLLIVFTIYLIYRKKLWHLQKLCCIIPLKMCRKEQLDAVSKKNAPIL